MKRTILFPLLILLTFRLTAQDFQIIQITNDEYDARNPFINHAYYYAYSDFLFFEMHRDNFSNIYAVSYDSQNQLFTDTIRITSGDYQDVKPSADDYENLYFVTNRNGNLDIAFKPYVNGNYGDIKFLTDSQEDEYDYIIVHSNSYGFGDSTRLLFRRANEIIYLTHLNDSVFSHPVFKDDTNFTYTDFTGIRYSNYPGGIPRNGLFIIAVETNNSGNKRLVSKFRDSNYQWNTKSIILDNCDCSNPDFQVIQWFSPVLSYEDTLNGERRLFYIEDWDLTKIPVEVDLPFSGNISFFKSDMPNMITKHYEKKKADDYPYLPHTYFVDSSGIESIRLNKLEFGWFPGDTLMNLNNNNTTATIGALGYDYFGMVYFTVWTDSINGRIHLFGRKQIVPVGAVEGETSLNDFILYQNYPNPFNPVTKIEYKTLSASDVRFEVINILGEKVFEENYGYQQSGNYTINFNGEDIPSGVYIYSVFAGENRLSRKMVLLR